MRAKPGPITSHTRSAGASMRNWADISDMPPGWRLAAGLAIPGKGIAARVTALAHWRHHRGLSQLALAGAAGTTARRVSFLETGRSRPNRR